MNRYTLNLSANFDRSVAKALVRIANHNVPEQFRNVTHSGRKFDPVQLANAPHNMPRHGVLEFDFLKMVVRARKDSCITSHTLQALQTVVASDKQSEMDRMMQITNLAEEMALSVEQLIGLLGKLDGSSSGSRLRCSVVVNLFSRLVDRAQFAQVEERLTREEQVTVRHVLGELYYFNEENPTGHYRWIITANKLQASF